MAKTNAAGQSGDQNASSFGETFEFHEVFKREIGIINARRTAVGPYRRDPIELESDEIGNAAGEEVLHPKNDAALIGLALSGGGIRSAAFCLGALQGLEATNVLGRVDYLSTVSGGGYIGCSLTAGMEATGGKFPFASRRQESARIRQEDEPPSVQHIRNYSNYLFPKGPGNFLPNIAIYMRGLAANAVLILPFILILAAITIIVKPDQKSLKESFIAAAIDNQFFPFNHFVTTQIIFLLIFAGMILWAVIRSLRRFQQRPEVSKSLKWCAGFIFVVVVGSAIAELQPFMLEAMFDPKASFFGGVVETIKYLAAALAPVAATVAFLGRKLGEFIKSSLESEHRRVKFAGFIGKVAIYVAALFVPLILWAGYLYLSFWGIKPYNIQVSVQAANLECIPTQSLSASKKSACEALQSIICWPNQNTSCEIPKLTESRTKTPEVLKIAAERFFDPNGAAVAWLYLVLALVMIPFSLIMRPNANSLHPLYRDRLAKAFLFKPKEILETKDDLDEFQPRLSGLSGECGPYHLINSALNIQNSRTANKRGRNADFYFFSKEFIGSKATGYVKTSDVEEVMPGLDLKTAMAASGAAASSNMGSQTIKPLTPTFALLNMRLGYWMRNPSWVKYAKDKKKRSRWNSAANYYFLLECFGLLDENRKSVYLTDGGHIENLGIYELLKRRCKVIIAVDAEADREMAFGSLNTVERYARIDLGIGIDLPWQQITDVSRETGTAIDEQGDAPKKLGPHCAIGEISYPGGHKGILIYIKSSLTGDENDYIFHYKKRYDDFPHETTLDQLFSEEQFEAYRALGFHAAFRFFDRRDSFAYLDLATRPDARSQIDFLDALFPIKRDQPSPQSKNRFSDWLANDRKNDSDDNTG